DRASVGAAADGSFVISWESSNFDGSDNNVVAQLYDPDGVPVGSDFQVNTYTTGNQVLPSLGVAPDGSFVIAWTSFNQVDNQDVFAQRYDAAGTAQGGEFLVNTYTSSAQYWPSVGVAGDGSFLVAWSDYYPPSATGEQTVAQRFDSGGSPVGSYFLVDTNTDTSQTQASVDGSSDGSFVVVWQDTGRDGSNYGVFGQLFDSSGMRFGQVFQVNTTTLNRQERPDVAFDEVGNFVVTWQSDPTGTNDDIHAQRFLAPCRESMTLRANVWSLIGLPCQPAAGQDTVGDVFGDDLPSLDYGLTWAVFERDETNDQYVRMSLSDSMTMGEGYWIIATDADTPIDVEGHNADYTCPAGSEFAAGGGCHDSPAVV
ncbi:MAG: hypothetical protein R3324_18935, partial [Halobacteriales archaeon]|nr:hypothetical protein [Halobacteriales archaeon]